MKIQQAFIDRRFEEAVGEVRADLEAFRLGWKWPLTIECGVTWGRTDLVRSDSIYVTPGGTHNLTQTARSIFDRLLPSVKDFRHWCRESDIDNRPDGTRGPVSRLSIYQERLFEMFRLELEAIALVIIVRTRASVGDLAEHNRKVSLLNLRNPIRDALWEGASIEDIFALAKEVQGTIPKRRPTLEESLAAVGAQLARRANADRNPGPPETHRP